MPKNTPPRAIDQRRTGGASFVSSGSGGGGTGVTDHGLLSGLTDDDHTQYHTDARGDARYLTVSASVTAGAGLTSTGTLASGLTLNVGAGNGIDVAADSIALASSVAGAALSYTSGVLAVVPGEGLEIETDAIGLKAAVAGAGLTYTTGVLAVGEGAGLTVSADAVALTTPGTLHVTTTNVAAGSHTHAVTSSSNPGAAAAILASDSAGGLALQTLTTGTAGSTAVANIIFPGHAVLSAARSAYLLLDTDANSTGATFTIQRDSSDPAVATELFRFTEAGRFGVGNAAPSYEADVTGTLRATDAVRTATAYATTKVQTPTIDTASGALSLSPASGTVTIAAASATLATDTGQALTIAPTGDLYLSPGGLDTITAQAAALRADNFLKTFPMAGYRIGPTSISGQSSVEAGSAEFDELRARIFVADETRVDRGQEYITKSYGILSRPFTAPASVGGLASIYFENSPHIAGAIFTEGDWILLRYLDMSSGIVLTSVWGTVINYNITGLTGEQRWTFELKQGTGGLAFLKGAMAVNFGQSGQGYILSDAVTATSPYIQVGKWAGANPYTPANISVLTQMGRLDGVGFTGEYGLAAAVTNYGVDAKWIKVSTAGAALNNLPLELTDSGTVKVRIGAWNDVWLGPSSSDKRLSWNGTTFAITGHVTATTGAIANWNIGVVDANTISSNNIRLISGATGTARLEVGDGTTAGTGGGIVSRLTATTAVLWAGQPYSTLISSPTTVPFRVNLNGDLFASNADIAGNVRALTGYIGTSSATATDGWTIASGLISSANIRLYSGTTSTARVELGTGTTTATAGIRGGGTGLSNTAFWAGAIHDNRDTAPFRVTLGGSLYATSADITGTVTATAGAIGGWTIDADELASGTDTIRLLSGAANTAGLYLGGGTVGNAGFIARSAGSTSAVTLWAGYPFDTSANLKTNAPFWVTMGGQLKASDAIFGDLKVNSSGIYVTAPTEWSMPSAGYKFMLDSVATCGLTTAYIANSFSYVYLDNNVRSPSPGSFAYQYDVDATTHIRSYANGLNKNGRIILETRFGAGTSTLTMASNATANTLVYTGASMTINGAAVLTTANEGSGNGIDADTLDGQEGGYYAPISNPTFPASVKFASVATPIMLTGGATVYLTAGERFVIAYSDGTNIKYRWMNLTGTDAAWNYQLNGTAPA